MLVCWPITREHWCNNRPHWPNSPYLMGMGMNGWWEGGTSIGAVSGAACGGGGPTLDTLMGSWVYTWSKWFPTFVTLVVRPRRASITSQRDCSWLPSMISWGEMTFRRWPVPPGSIFGQIILLRLSFCEPKCRDQRQSLQVKKVYFLVVQRWLAGAKSRSVETGRRAGWVSARQVGRRAGRRPDR